MRMVRGRAAPVALAALVGVLIGAGLVWVLLSGQSGQNRQGLPRAVSGPTPAVSAQSQDAIVAAVRRVGPAVVNISTEYRSAESPLDRMVREWMGIPSQPFPRQGQGSGIIIDGARGYVLTNAHVVRRATRVRVGLADARTFDAEVVGADPLTDVAVVRIKGSNLPAAELGRAAEAPIGSWVIAIGNPFGFENSVTVGVLSAKGRQISDPGTGISLQDLLQTDASINPGNSGGALVDLAGRVVGMPTAVIPQAQGIGFAISIDLARVVAEKLIQSGRMPWLGVSYRYLPAEEATRAGLARGGALVMEVVPGGPAAQAGLQPRDVIVSCGGSPVNRDGALGEIIRRHNVGDRVEVVVWRASREVKLRATLGAVPEHLAGPG